MGRGYTFRTLEVFEILEKMQHISARKEYVMDRPEGCEVARRTIVMF